MMKKYEHIQYVGESIGCATQGRFYNIDVRKIKDKDNIERYVAFIYYPHTFENCLGAITYIPRDWRHEHYTHEIFKV